MPICDTHHEDEPKQEEAEVEMTLWMEELNTDNPPNSTDVEVQAEGEPNLFDILNEGAGEIVKDDLIDDQQIADNEEEDDQE